MGAFVQGKFAFTDASGQASLGVTFDSDVKAGNLIAVFIKFGTATSVFNNVTDSLGNTYNVVDTDTTVPGTNTGITLYARNIAGGANTVTLNFTGSTGVFPRIMVMELS